MKRIDKVKEQFRAELAKKEGSGKPKILSMLVNCTDKHSLTGWKRGKEKNTSLYLRVNKRVVRGWEPAEITTLLSKGNKVNYFTQANFDRNINPLAMFIRLTEKEDAKFKEWSPKIKSVTEHLNDNAHIYYTVELGKEQSMEIVTVSD